MTRTLHTDTRGVSQVMGYALIFGLVLSTAVLTLSFAQPIIEDHREQQASLTATYSFEHLDTYVKKIEHGANQRFVRMELPAGELNSLQQTRIHITSNTSSKEATISTRPIVYQPSATSESIIYDGRIIAYKPSTFDTSRSQIRSAPISTYIRHNYIFPIPNISTSDNSIGLSSTRTNTVTFLINRTNYQDFRDNSRDVKTITEASTTTFGSGTATATNLTITVTTNVPSLWIDYLHQHPAVTSVSAPTYTPGQRTTITATATLAPDETLTVVNYNISIYLLSNL